MSLMEKIRNWQSKLNNRYRLTILDDETLEEVTSFQLTKKSLYIGVCSVIIILVVVSGVLLSVTPLRYYIPGYGDIKQRKEYINVNTKVDSLETLINAQSRYLNSIQAVLRGKEPAKDTSLLKALPKGSISN